MEIWIDTPCQVARINSHQRTRRWGDPAVFDLTAEALSEIRRAKTEAKRSLKTVAEKVTIRDTTERLALLKSVTGDLSAAGNINELEFEPHNQKEITITLVPEE